MEGLRGLDQNNRNSAIRLPNGMGDLTVYPKTGHVIDRPAQEVEVMERNVDWFDYWMLGKKEPDPEKGAQYSRCRQMQDEMRQLRQLHPCSNERSSTQ